MATDTYLKSASYDALAQFCAYFRNVIGPRQGHAAFVDEEGTHPAAGEPGTFYACIRAPFQISAPDGIAAATAEETVPVVGMWAENAGKYIEAKVPE